MVRLLLDMVPGARSYLQKSTGLLAQACDKRGNISMIRFLLEQGVEDKQP